VRWPWRRRRWWEGIPQENLRRLLARAAAGLEQKGFPAAETDQVLREILRKDPDVAIATLRLHGE
jgi:hypothetical protein